MLALCLAPSLWMAACQPNEKNQASVVKEQLQRRDRKPIELPLSTLTVAEFQQAPAEHLRHAIPDARVWQRRLESFRLKVKATAQAPEKVSAVELQDEHTWRQAKAGGWHVRHLAKGNVVEWMAHGDKLLVKNGKGDWRHRPLRIEFAEQQPNEVLASIADTLALAGPRLQATQAQATVKDGRKGHKLKLGLGSPEAAEAADVSADSLSGEVFFDAETGLLLSGELQFVVKVAPLLPPTARPVVLENGFPPAPPTVAQKLPLKLSFAVELPKNGESFETTLPKYIDEVVRPRPNAHPLAFWPAATPKTEEHGGKEGAGAKSGSAKEADDDE